MSVSGCVKVNGFEMEYFKFGTGSRPFVILPGLCIQSIMGAADAVESSYGTMSDDFTLYVFDRRKEYPVGYSIIDMADDTAVVMKEMGLKDTFVFGASQGGMIALALTIRYPELVRKLALGSTSPHVNPEQQRVVDKWIKLAKEGKKVELYQEYGKEIYPPDVYEQFKQYFTDVAATVTDEELEKFVIMASSIKDFDVSAELAKINCPVLALGVYEDPVLDSDATMEIAENLDYRPDFKLYMYKGYGHAAFDTAPDYKKRVIDFFLKDENN